MKNHSKNIEELERIVTEVALVRGAALVVTAHAGPHRDGLLLGNYVALGDRTVTRAASNSRVAVMKGVREVNVVGNTIDLDPGDRLVLLFKLGQPLNVRAVGLDRGMACHAGRFLGVAGSEAGVLDRVTIETLEAQAHVDLVAKRNRLLGRLGDGALGPLAGLSKECSDGS